MNKNNKIRNLTESEVLECYLDIEMQNTTLMNVHQPLRDFDGALPQKLRRNLAVKHCSAVFIQIGFTVLELDVKMAVLLPGSVICDNVGVRRLQRSGTNFLQIPASIGFATK